MYNMGEWLAEWLRVYKLPYLKPDSARRINNVINKHIPQWLKNKPLKAVKAVDVDKAISACPYSRTRKYLYGVFASALHKAYCLDLIKIDIKAKLEPVKHKQKRGKALTIAEQTAFLKAISNTKYQYYFEFLLLSGCRRSEGLSVKWEDVDEPAGVIYIHGTKTESSERVILLSDRLKAVLQKQKQQAYAGGLIFPFDASNVSHAFKRYCPNHKLHDLRHTFVTRCAESGVHISVAQKLAGHSDINTTLQIYTHVITEFQRAEFAKFDINK